MKLNFPKIRACMAITASAIATGALAQDAGNYPSSPVRIIVPLSPGGATDIQARLFALELSKDLGKSFVVENKAGGASTIGSAYVAKQAPDGYTLLATTPSFTFGPALRKIPYDPIKDFTPITLVTRAPYLLDIHPSVPVNNLKEWVDYIKNNDAKVNVGIGGPGSFTHLAMAWLEDLAGLKLHYVNYKGTGPVLLDLMAGRVQTAFSNPLSTMKHIHAGKIRAIAITMNERVPALPDIPTIAESGYPGYNLSTWHGYVGPAGLPRPIVNYLASAYSKMVKSPEISEKLKPDGGVPVGSTPEAFADMIGKEMAHWRALVKKIGLNVQ